MSADQASVLARLDGVTIRRRSRTIVEQFDLDLTPTGLTLLGGENGAGKTTLLNALCGLLTPAVGRVLVGGHDLAERSGRRHTRGDIVLLPQAPSCPRSFTVADLLHYSAWLQSVTMADREARITWCLDLVGLRDVAGRRVHHLSGGEQRRAFIASALIGEPRLLLLDEPTVGLDAAQRVAVRAVLRHAATQRALVVTSHIAEDFEHLADRIVLVDHGRIIFDGDPASFSKWADGADGTMSRSEAAFAAILRVAGAR